MKKHFVVVIDSPTVEQRKAVVDYLGNTNKFGYWHWIKDFWLVITYSDSITAATIRDGITEVAPGLSVAVFGVTPNDGDWALLSNPKWGEWLNENWKT